MPGRDVFTVEGRVVAVRQPGLLQVELVNGHRLIAFGRARDRARWTTVEPGTQVWVEVSPFDLSKGRLVSGGSDRI